MIQIYFILIKFRCNSVICLFYSVSGGRFISFFRFSGFEILWKKYQKIFLMWVFLVAFHNMVNISKNRWIDFDLPMTFANINFANRMCAKTTIVTRSFFGKLTFPVGGQFDYPFLIFLYTSGIETNKCLMLPAYIYNFSHANEALIDSSAIQLILFLLKDK